MRFSSPLRSRAEHSCSDTARAGESERRTSWPPRESPPRWGCRWRLWSSPTGLRAARLHPARRTWTRPGSPSSSTCAREELGALPLVTGGRSSGARVACRTARATHAAAVLCLAFPLQPPRREGAAPAPSRLAELAEVSVPVLIVQGERDPFGLPPSAPLPPGDDRARRPQPADGSRSARSRGRVLAPRNGAGRDRGPHNLSESRGVSAGTSVPGAGTSVPAAGTLGQTPTSRCREQELWGRAAGTSVPGAGTSVPAAGTLGQTPSSRCREQELWGGGCGNLGASCGNSGPDPDFPLP